MFKKIDPDTHFVIQLFQIREKNLWLKMYRTEKQKWYTYLYMNFKSDALHLENKTITNVVQDHVNSQIYSYHSILQGMPFI